MKKFKIRFKGKSRGPMGIIYVVVKYRHFNNGPTELQVEESLKEKYDVIEILEIEEVA